MRGLAARIGGSALAFLLGSCQDSVQFVPYPELPAVQSILTIPVGAQRIYGSNDLSRLELPVADEEPNLLLLGYDRTLEALGLVPGPMPLAARCRDCALLSPSAVFLREARGDWRDLEGVIPEWAQLALVEDGATRCSACPFFDSERLLSPEVDAASRLRLAPWDDDSVVALDVATDGLFRVYASGEIAPACQNQPRLRTWAVFRGLGAILWLIDGDGVVRRMDLDALDATRSCASATSTQTPALSVVPSALLVQSEQPLLVYALVPPQSDADTEAHLHRFQDGQWTRLHTFRPSGGAPALAEDPDGVVYAVVGGPELASVRGSELTVWKPTDPSIGFEFTVVAHLPEFGVVTASRLRGLMVTASLGTWAPIDGANRESLGAERFAAIRPYGAGVLLANYQGGLHYYSSARGYCDQLTLFGREKGREFITLPDGTVFSAEEQLHRGWPRSTSCAP